MIFSKIDIEKAIEDKEIIISPFSKESVRLASVELSLGNEVFYIPKDNVAIDILKPETCSDLKCITYLDSETMNVEPGQFIITTSKETIELSSGIIARVEGETILRSLGLIIIAREEHLEPGSKGIISLIIQNIGTKTIVLRPGTKICQLVFEQLLTPVEGRKETKVKETKSTKKE